MKAQSWRSPPEIARKYSEISYIAYGGASKKKHKSTTKITQSTRTNSSLSISEWNYLQHEHSKNNIPFDTGKHWFTLESADLAVRHTSNIPTILDSNFKISPDSMIDILPVQPMPIPKAPTFWLLSRMLSCEISEWDQVRANLWPLEHTQDQSSTLTFPFSLCLPMLTQQECLCGHSPSPTYLGFPADALDRTDMEVLGRMGLGSASADVFRSLQTFPKAGMMRAWMDNCVRGRESGI